MANKYLTYDNWYLGCVGNVKESELEPKILLTDLKPDARLWPNRKGGEK